MLAIRGAAPGLLDDPLLLDVSGAPPGAALTWRARIRDDDGFVWRATGAAPDALAWVAAKPSSAGAIAALRSLRPVDVDVRVEAADGTGTSRTLTRSLLGEGAKVRRWKGEVTGTLYLPAKPTGGATILDARGAPLSPSDVPAAGERTPAPANNALAGREPAQAPPNNAPAGREPAQAPPNNAPAAREPAQAPPNNAPAAHEPAPAPPNNAPAAHEPAPAPPNDLSTAREPTPSSAVAASPADVAPLAAALLASRGVLAFVLTRGDVNAAGEQLARVPSAPAQIAVVADIPVPAGVPAQAPADAAAWDALLERLGARPRRLAR